MALTVETGAIVAGAESYVSVADADTYWSNRGNAAWAALTTAEKEQHLRIATARLDKSWVWLGIYTNETTQALEWPRYNVIDRRGRAYDSDEIPQDIKNAVCELADQNRNSALDVRETSRQATKEKLGDLEIQYNDYGDQQPVMHWIDDMVQHLTVGGGGVSFVRSS